MKVTWKVIKISIGMLVVPVIIGGFGIKSFLNWNPYHVDETLKATSQKEQIDVQVTKFREDWTKNRTEHLSLLSVASKQCTQDIKNDNYDLPEPIQRIVDIIEEKI